MGRDSGIGSVGGTVGRPKLSMGLMGGQPCMEHMVPWDVLHGTRYFEGILGHPSWSCAGITVRGVVCAGIMSAG